MLIYKTIAFCLTGSSKNICEDRVLVDKIILSEGLYSSLDTKSIFSFLADGIGGVIGGDFASSYILHQINNLITADLIEKHQLLIAKLRIINSNLIFTTSSTQSKVPGAGTTLVGALATQDKFLLVYAGDSEAWLLRNNEFSRMTFPQNLDPFKENSPLISYFGGHSDQLDLQIEPLPYFNVGDILMLCSDGLFKVFDENRIKLILSNKQSLLEKARFIYQKALEAYRPDDLSCILIEAQEKEEAE